MLVEPDLATVERARCGDHQAFAAIVVAYQHKVHDLLARMLAGIVSLAEVEELAQETFVRIYRALPRFAPEAPGAYQAHLRPPDTLPSLSGAGM